MHKRQPPKGLSPLEKRVPKTNKYDHVQNVVETGLTVNKVKYVTSREYAKRRDEIFFRITRRQLHELYGEYEQDEYENITEVASSHTGMTGGPRIVNHGDNHRSNGSMNSPNSPRIVTYDETDTQIYTKPYLILDVRPYEEFQQCHLLQARSFPYANLRRDQYHPEIYRFRNKAEHLIIVYCNDEKVSTAVAKDLVDRGIDNVFLLTGGMTYFLAEFPEFLEGHLPEELEEVVHQIQVSAMRKQSQSQSSSGRGGRLGSIQEDKPYAASPRDQLTTSKLERHNQKYSSMSSNSGSLNSARRSVTSRNTYSASDAGTARSNMSVAESVISRATAKKGKF